jgi:hypothetical protein
VGSCGVSGRLDTKLLRSNDRRREISAKRGYFTGPRTGSQGSEVAKSAARSGEYQYDVVTGFSKGRSLIV